MPKGFFTQSACVLLSNSTSLDAIAPLLLEFSIAKRVDQTTDPHLGGPALILAFRPEVNPTSRIRGARTRKPLQIEAATQKVFTTMA